MRLWALCCVVSCALGVRTPAPPRPHRDVVTSSGVARGYLRPRPLHYAFLGVPYARTPTHRDRFKAPESDMRWDGVFEATYRVRCAQPGHEGDAACLVVNVFAPERADLRPVLVHLHDGHFATGWGSHNAPRRLLRLGFVVVTLNYRLGVDGFLCLGTPEAPGNAGLKDQVAALEWIYTNIDKFGGEATQVTLYGTGAGAAAAELLLLSGAIDGVVQRVVMEGGTALAPTSLADEPVATALQVANALGYDGEDTQKLAKFYHNTTTRQVLDYSNRFAPCVESVANYNSSLLIKDPKEILGSGIFTPVPLLIAYSKETSPESDILFRNVPNNFEELLPNNLEFESEDVKFKIGEAVKQSYFSEQETNGGDVSGSYESYMNDVFTVYPVVKSATLHAVVSNSPVYLMEFIPRVENSNIFEYIFSQELFNEEEELIARKLVTMWSNFMVYSDPTPLKTTLLPMVWSPVTFRVRNEKPDISTASCLVFDLSKISMSMGTPSSEHTLAIWDHIYDNFYKSKTQKLELPDKDVMSFEELPFITLPTQTNTQESKLDRDNRESVDDANDLDVRFEGGIDRHDNYDTLDQIPQKEESSVMSAVIHADKTVQNSETGVVGGDIITTVETAVDADLGIIGVEINTQNKLAQNADDEAIKDEIYTKDITVPNTETESITEEIDFNQNDQEASAPNDNFSVIGL